MRVFEPVKLMDTEYGNRLKSHYKPKLIAEGAPSSLLLSSFRQVEDFKEEKWRKEEHIEVSFWNENDYQAHIMELASKFTT